jgi:hypothetical protein
VSVPAARPGLPWAVIVMEGAVIYPALSTWLAGPDRRVPLGPAAAVAMLALGYLAAQHSPLFGHRVQRLEYGAAASLLARLLVSAWSGAPSPLVWLGTAVVPAAVGLALWWRGVSLGESEFSIDGVRNEFTIAGGALLVLLTVFRDVAGIDPYTSAIAVVLFLSSGLMAVGTARQEAAGLPASPAASALVALAALILLVASLALVGLLSPELVAVLLSLAGDLLGFVLGLLVLPLELLFSWLHLGPIPPPEMPAPPQGLPPDLAEQAAVPEWLQVALTAAITALIVVGLVVALVVLAWLLLAVVQRVSPRGSARAPVAVEAEGALWQDAEALVDALRGWLARLAGGARAAVPSPRTDHLVRDARAAYRALLRWAKGRGLERAAGETPREFERRLARELPDGAAHYRALTETYEWARYGGVPASAADLARLRQSLAALASVTRPTE